MAKIKKYNWSDAWLLLAIIYAGGTTSTASLGKIIGAGDCINHAVFNRDELESGLARLTTGNFIREQNKTFFVTLKVKRFFAETTSPRRAVHKELRDIEHFLCAAAATNEQPNINDLKYDGFSHKEFSEAVNKHLTS